MLESLIDFLQQNAWLKDVAQALSTIVGLAFVGIQVRSARLLNSARFINHLTDELSKHEKTFARIIAHNDGPLRGEPLEISHDEIMPIIGFFEKLAILTRSGTLDMRDIDLLFRKRFYCIFENSAIQQLVIQNETYKPYLRLLFELKTKWDRLIKR